MFVVDFIAASVLTFVLTVGFAAVVRSRGYSRLSDMSGDLWLMTITSWIGGILLIGFGPSLTGTHWLPFAVAGFLAGLLVITLPNLPKFGRAVHNPGNDARPAIATYFFLTLLLFLCAVSLRFYLVNLA